MEDPAESPSASYYDDPSEGIDSLEDLIREAISSYNDPLPNSISEFRKVVEKIYLSAISSTDKSLSVQECLTNYVEGQLSERIWEAIAQVISNIVDSPNPRRTADLYACVTGIRIRQGITLTDLAKKYGVSKQALDKQLVQLCEKLDLPPPRLMKSQMSRESYRLANHRKIKNEQK
ncbi:MAG: hypothetical protein EBT82_03900 [Micrococcales bacterium]|nr:hypothetical protein [Micrococcales bacterium]